MAVKFTKPEINVREKLAELDKPSGIAGEAMLRAETPQEQFNLIGAGRRNLIINGGFDIWQRGTSHAAGTAGGITYTTDRWWRYGGGSGTLEKSTDAPAGFPNSFYVNSTSALAIGTTVELPRLGYFPQQVMTFSMYVKGSFTGNIIFNFRNVTGSGTDQVAISTQSQAGFYSEWTRLIFTVDTTGITPHANNTALNIEMGVQVGVRITGAQLEVGKVATPFEHRSYGEELALCQRYYQRITGGGYSWITEVQRHNNTGFRSVLHLPVPLRVVPSISYSNLAYWYNNGSLSTGTQSLGMGYTATGRTDISHLNLEYIPTSMTLTTNGNLSAMLSFTSAGGYLDFSSEL